MQYMVGIVILLGGCVGLERCGRSFKTGSVDVTSRHALNEIEISGLGMRRNVDIADRSQQDEVLIVGDRNFEIGLNDLSVQGDWASRRRILGASASDAAGAEPGEEKVAREMKRVLGIVVRTDIQAKKEKKPSSQFEAVAGDESGLIAVLSEEASQVLFFRGSGKFESSLKLSVPEDSPLYKDWQKDGGSRGEGMVLLRSGNILLLKEKKPSLLIEFGPKGSNAGGYYPGAAIVVGAATGEGESQRYSVPKDGAEFVPLKWWSANADAKSEAHDLSEITVTRTGKLLALSDQSRAIFEIEKNLKVDEEKFGFKCAWDLPSEIDKPEGLVVLPDASNGLTVLVASDQKEYTDNVFQVRLGECK